MMGRSGLQQSEAPLVMNLEKAFEQATTKAHKPWPGFTADSYRQFLPTLKSVR